MLDRPRGVPTLAILVSVAQSRLSLDRIDPKVFEVGKRFNAKVDLGRDCTSADGEQTLPPCYVIGNTHLVGTNSQTAYIGKTNPGLVRQPSRRDRALISARAQEFVDKLKARKEAR